jgi:hypothetical protein
MKIRLTMVALLMAFTTVFAQDYTIEFRNEITTTDTSMLDAIEMMGGGNDMTTYISDSKYRVETSMGMAGETTIIVAQDSMLLLMDNAFLGKKYRLLSAESDSDTNEYVVKKTNETIDIAGFKCQKYIVTVTGSEGETIVYTTSKIKGPATQAYGDRVPGYALKTISEQEVMGSKINSVMTATSVKKGKISIDKFSLTPPEGYEIMEDF